MTRLLRTFSALAALVAVAAALGAPTVQAQESVPTAQAQSFLGAWAIAMDAQGQAFVMNLDIKDASGNVAAELSSDQMPGTTTASRVARDGDHLVLNFTVDAQGMVVPMVMRLTPEGDALNANVDFADGMFVAAGKGTKR